MKLRSKSRVPSKRGPKADPGAARATILAAARAEFGKHGFEATTLRSIATMAKVDVALLSYYFGSKGDLFVASLDLPVNPAQVLRSILSEGIDGAGARVLRLLLNVWDQPETGAPLIAMLRSLSTQASVLRRFIERRLIAPLTAELDGPDAELRATAFTSQIIGLVLERYVLAIGPLAAASHDEIVDLIAPNLQAYLDGSPR
jgi:AcrR family transcriptional regulator